MGSILNFHLQPNPSPELTSRAVLASEISRPFLHILTVFRSFDTHIASLFSNMARLSIAFVLSALTCTIFAAPLQKRIAQVIADSTTQWEAACIAAGGGQSCNPVSVTAFSTLLAAAGPCDQQNSGDAMIDLAKTLNNDPDMIKFTQIFVQQPRNSVSVSQ